MRDGLPETVRRVLDAVPVRRSVGVAALARAARTTPLVVQQVTPPLEAHGLVQRTPEGWRLTALGTGRAPATEAAPAVSTSAVSAPAAAKSATS